MTKPPCLCSGMQPPQPPLAAESLHAVILSLNLTHLLRKGIGIEYAAIVAALLPAINSEDLLFTIWVIHIPRI